MHRLLILKRYQRVPERRTTIIKDEVQIIMENFIGRCVPKRLLISLIITSEDKTISHL